MKFFPVAFHGERSSFTVIFLSFIKRAEKGYTPVVGLTVAWSVIVLWSVYLHVVWIDR